MTPDQGYCVHGMPVAAGCFFCRNRSRTVVETIAARRSAIPEHRNPRAAETSPSRSFSISARRGAAAKHKTTPPAIDSAPPQRRGGRRKPTATRPRQPKAKVEPTPAAPALPAVVLAPAPAPVPDHRLSLALRRLRNLERELVRMQEILVRTVADITAAQKGEG